MFLLKVMYRYLTTQILKGIGLSKVKIFIFKNNSWGFIFPVLKFTVTKPVLK
jgi:hypothetical protein